MQGSFLRFYVHEGQSHHHGLVWEWLLMRANKLGIRGGSAFRAMAGFGRHHQVVTEARFFDLKGSQVIEIEFVVTDQEAQQLLDLLHREGISLFYAYIPSNFGTMDRNAPSAPSIGSPD